MKPILFNTEMVQAILNGQKTVTRRVIKSPTYVDHEEDYPSSFRIIQNGTAAGLPIEYKPYYPGDILYVRETWLPFDTDHVIDGVKYAYKANCSPESERIRTEYGYKWRPSIHMPKEAARIFLRVTDVRVERLQDMTEEQACGEGFDVICPYEHRCWVGSPYDGGYESMCWSEGDCQNPEKWCNKSVPELFGMKVWDKIINPKDHDKYGWNANPWVWVIEFERIEKARVEEYEGTN